MHTYHVVESGVPLKSADKAIIVLHGRGATAQDIIGLAQEFADETFYIAAPQATNRSWYPNSFLADEATNEPWLTSAVENVKKLIDEICLHILVENVYLMGFSQGACLSLEVAGRYAAQYAGIAAFTGGLIGKQLNKQQYSGSFKGTKIFIGNSDQDPHVPVNRCEQSKEILQALGGDVTLNIYPGMAHTIVDEEIATVKKLMF